MINNLPKTLFDAILLVGHDEDFWDVVPEQPTAAAPGSLEKIDVFKERLARGESLWHPNDCRIAASPEKQTEMQVTVKARVKATVYVKRKKAF